VIGIFFLRYCAWKSYYVCVLGWYWYIWVISIAIFAFVIFGHPFNSHHKYHIVFWTNRIWFFLVMVFLKIFLFNLGSRICHPFDRWILWKTDYEPDLQIPKVSGLRWAFSPSSCRAFRSIPSDLYQVEVLWWISSFILQTSCLEDVNLRITSFRLCKIKRLKFFLVHGSWLLELEAKVVQIQPFVRISFHYLISVD
jgi:hypothetical protein